MKQGLVTVVRGSGVKIPFGDDYGGMSKQSSPSCYIWAKQRHGLAVQHDSLYPK